MKIGYALCGSFCTHARSVAMLEKLASEHEIVPIASETVVSSDTRFGRASELIEKIEAICSRKIICNIVDAEPLGPREVLDALIISPCTGNTLSKIANGITDTAVTMAAKAHLRSDRPLIIALSTNDALSANLKNIATLLERKNVYFVPLTQDDPLAKPHSLVCELSLLPETLEAAMQGRQYQRVIK